MAAPSAPGWEGWAETGKVGRRGSAPAFSIDRCCIRKGIQPFNCNLPVGAVSANTIQRKEALQDDGADLHTCQTPATSDSIAIVFAASLVTALATSSANGVLGEWAYRRLQDVSSSYQHAWHGEADWLPIGTHAPCVLPCGQLSVRLPSLGTTAHQAGAVDSGCIEFSV